MFHVKSLTDIALQSSACALLFCAFFPVRGHIRLQLVGSFLVFLAAFLILFA